MVSRPVRATFCNILTYFDQFTAIPNICAIAGPLPLILHCVHRAFQMVVVSLEVSKWWARRRPGGSRQMSSQSAVGCAMTSWWDSVGSHRSSHRKPVVYPHVLSIRKNDQKRKRSFDNILVFGQISRFLTRKKNRSLLKTHFGARKKCRKRPQFKWDVCNEIKD